jgi:hypothetical protein
MSTGKHSFKLTDAKRAIRAARAEGIARPVMEIDPRTGKITIRSEPTTQPSPPTVNPWDDLLTDKGSADEQQLAKRRGTD